ncbi:MAG: gamma-glutamyltransferase [Brachybacterium sp.]|nr:gamma-glutamyltransferase [Brachybacterium sp.]
MTSFVPPPAHTTRPTLQGTVGMTASTHWLATASAQAVLERGGTAIDAAVAGAFVLHVVEPHLNGPGGDMVGLVATETDEFAPRVLMGQGPAPAGATLEAYRALGLTDVPGAGALAAAVPTAVDAWLMLLEREGTWELADVLSFAIGYAEDGHPVLTGVADRIAAMAETFTTHWPSSAVLWMPEGRPPRAGELIRNPEYAAVLCDLIAAGDTETTRETRIAAARREWRTGRVAHAIAEFVGAPHRHSDGNDYAGVLTAEDLAGVHAGFEDPVSITFRGRTIVKAGPWTQGPVLLQTLRILDGFADAEIDPSTERGAHHILEALKLALADRDAWYGDLARLDDPDPSVAAHARALLADLLSEEYATERRALITDRASTELRPGSPGGRRPHLPPALTDAEHARRADPADGLVGSGEPTVPGAATRVPDTDDLHRGDTCHLDVVDAAGRMVSATPSGGWLQSSPAIPGIGFCLGTRLQMTWLDEDSPSALTAGARPRTTLTPTMIYEGDEPVAALGTPGGDQQDQWQLLLILRLLVGGYAPQEAIDAPMLHTTSMIGSFWPRTWSPGGAVVEDRLGADVIAGLEERGHRVQRAGEWSLGRLSIVTRDPATGVLQAAANSRGAQGYAAGR